MISIRLVRSDHIAAVLIATVLVSFASDAYAQRTRRTPIFTHKLTIYVDEGVGERNGHVFVELSDGTNRVVKGFYPRQPGVTALVGGEGSAVRPDLAKIESGQWNVKRTYKITRTGYNNALRTIEDFEGGRRAWSVVCHCGSFAEEVAKAAGVPIRLPEARADLDNRPQLFSAYLRRNGGIVNGQQSINESASAPPKPTANQACQAEYNRRYDVLKACREVRSACLDKCRANFGPGTPGDDLFSSGWNRCNSGCAECKQEDAAWSEMIGKCNW